MSKVASPNKAVGLLSHTTALPGHPCIVHVEVRCDYLFHRLQKQKSNKLFPTSFAPKTRCAVILLYTAETMPL